MTTLSEALAPKSDQLNADDLIPGPRVLKITGARISSEDRQKRMSLSYEGDNGKPFKPCKTMGRAMVMVWAITDEGYEQQLVGKSIRVYRDPEVRFGDQGQVGGIRISHMSHIDKPASVKLTVSQGKKSVFTFHPLVTEAAPAAAEDEALKWTNAFIGKVKKTEDEEALLALTSSRAKQIEDLRERPELHRRVTDAIGERREFFSEGRATEDHGDQHDDDETTKRVRVIVADIVTRANNATTIAAVENLDGVLEQHRPAMTPEQATECEVALSDARGRVS
jgi:hypothetical protein